MGTPACADMCTHVQMGLQVGTQARTSARTNTHSHARTRTHTHTHARARTHAFMGGLACACTLTHHRYRKPRSSYKYIRPELQQRDAAFKKGGAYLERYCKLIAFAYYLEHVGPEGGCGEPEVARMQDWHESSRGCEGLPVRRAACWAGGWEQKSHRRLALRLSSGVGSMRAHSGGVPPLATCVCALLQPLELDSCKALQPAHPAGGCVTGPGMCTSGSFFMRARMRASMHTCAHARLEQAHSHTTHTHATQPQ